MHDARYMYLVEDLVFLTRSVDLPDLILWSSYEGQTVDALAVGGDEGRG